MSAPSGWDHPKQRADDPPRHERTNGLATAGFIVSLVGMVSGMVFAPLALPLLIIGIVLSAVSLQQCRLGIGTGRGLATAGLVMGIFGLALGVMLSAFFAGAHFGP